MATPERSTAAPIHPNSIEKLKPTDVDQEVAIVGAPGLRLRLTRVAKDGKGGGSKTFRWYIHDTDKSTGKRKHRVVTLGRWSRKSKPGFLTTAEAQVALEKLRDAHIAGKLDEAVAQLPAARPSRKKKTDVPAGVLTVKAAVDDFLASLDRKRPEQARRTFDVDVIPVVGDMAIAAVKRDDIRRVVSRVVHRGSPVQARNVLALLRQLMTWAADEALIEASPAAGRFKGKKALGTKKGEPSRRYLSPKEIVAFWDAVGESKSMTPTVKGALKLLLLTGLRTQELRLATWDAVDFDEGKPEAERNPTLTVPPANSKLTVEKAKTAGPFVVPLAPLAITILRSLKPLADSIGSGNVLASFAGRGAPLTEKAVGHAMRKLFDGDPPALKLDGEQPSPHDLRRTCRTHLEETLDFPEAICERVLNHKRPGIIDIYARGEYFEARKRALAAWDAYVARLISGQGATVVGIRSKAKTA